MLNKLVLQVFEYLSTDLKKFMDRNGKGPNFPLNPRLIKVPCSEPTAFPLWDTVQAVISQHRQLQCLILQPTSSVPAIASTLGRGVRGPLFNPVFGDCRASCTS